MNQRSLGAHALDRIGAQLANVGAIHTGHTNGVGPIAQRERGTQATGKRLLGAQRGQRGITAIARGARLGATRAEPARCGTQSGDEYAPAIDSMAPSRPPKAGRPRGVHSTQISNEDTNASVIASFWSPSTSERTSTTSSQRSASKPTCTRAARRSDESSKLESTG